MMWEEEAPVEVGDDTPGIREQAAKHGWSCDFFNFGKAEGKGFEFFNPGLVRRPDGLWLLVRSSELVKGMPYGKNRIWACQLENGVTPKGGPTLVFKDSSGEEQMEDPRAVYWNGQTWMAVVNFTWFANGSWTGAHIMLGIFKDQGDGANITEASWTPLARRDPPVGTNQAQKGNTNGRHNKNVLPFFHENKLHLLYRSDPWQIFEFGAKWEDQTEHTTEGVKWNYGVVRGGTPPVLVGDKYFSFFHSSLPWRGRYRRYYMGALAFEAKPPFQPVLWTREPLLIGSQNDPWAQRKPLVVFPCGALMENGKWFISLGVNDLRSAYLEIPHGDLLKLLNPLPVLPGLSLLADQTEKPVFEPIPYDDLSGDNAGNGGSESIPANGNVDPSAASTAEISPAECNHSRQSDQEPVQSPSQNLSPLEKARAALAEKRRLGTLVRKPNRKKIRKRGRPSKKRALAQQV